MIGEGVMMAAAEEVRSVAKRTANRYFIQEDAKRTPKLAYSSSNPNSSLLSKQSSNTTDANDNFTLLNDQYYSSFSSDSKCWLQLHPDYMYQRGLTSEQVNTLESQNSCKFVESQDGSSSSINSVSKECCYELIEMDTIGPKWWQNDDLSHDFLKPQKTKSQNEISRAESQPVDLSKSKILEALCHSQTRARKAENSAKEANTEKEHVIKLLFSQALQLFAYRQWVYLLQLEIFYNQIKNNKSSPIFSQFGKLNKNSKNGPTAKGKRTRSRHGVGRFERDIGKYAVVFVMGLGIVGAGLLFGWSIGWMMI